MRGSGVDHDLDGIDAGHGQNRTLSRHVARIVVAFGHHSGYGRGEHGVLAGVAEGTLGRGKCVSGVDELDLHLVHLLLGAASYLVEFDGAVVVDLDVLEIGLGVVHLCFVGKKAYIVEHHEALTSAYILTFVHQDLLDAGGRGGYYVVEHFRFDGCRVLCVLIYGFTVDGLEAYGRDGLRLCCCLGFLLVSVASCEDQNGEKWENTLFFHEWILLSGSYFAVL